MPSMYVNVPKLPQETKDTLVAKLYEAAAPVLKAPTSTPSSTSTRPSTKTASPPPSRWWWPTWKPAPPRRRRSTPWPRGCGPPSGEVLGEDKDLTLVFHDNALDRLAIGGVTIATKMKEKPPGLAGGGACRFGGWSR